MATQPDAALTVRPTPDGRGLGLCATRRFSPGALLLDQETPLAAALPPEAAAWRCRACLAPLSARSRARIPPCAGCGAARWCDAACRAEDAVGHAGSGECALLAAEAAAPAALLAWPGSLRDACLALRLLVRPDGAGRDLACDGGGAGGTEPARLAAAGSALAAAAGVGAATAGVVGARPPVSPSAAAAALRIAALNAVELEEAGGSGAGPPDNPHPPPGAALFRTACRANHSCRPTAAFVARRRGRLSLRAMVRLEAGQEVTVAYTDPVSPGPDRREALAAGWGFGCACARCREEGAGGGSPSAWLGEVAGPASFPALASLEAAVEAAGRGSGGRDPAAAVVAALACAVTAALAAGVGPAHAALLRAHLLLSGACAAVKGRPAAGAALLSAAIPALAADTLVRAGETGALLFGGRAWAGLAGRLLQCAVSDVRDCAADEEDWAAGLEAAAVAAGAPRSEAPPTAVGPRPPPRLAPALEAALAAARRVAAGPPTLIPLDTLDASLGRLGAGDTAPAASPAPPPPPWAVWAGAAAAAAAHAADLLSFASGEGSAAEAAAFSAFHTPGLPCELAAAVTAAVAAGRTWGPGVLL